MATKMNKTPAFDENNNAIQMAENELTLTGVATFVECFSSRQTLDISRKKSPTATVNSISGLRYASLAQVGKFKIINMLSDRFHVT